MKTRSLALISSLTLAILACGSEDDAIVDTTDGDSLGGDSEDDATADTTDDATADTIVTHDVDWRGCGVLRDRDILCAELEVPLDHDQPDGETIEISMNRFPANPSVPYRGVLFVNPGGPGSSGKNFALGLASQGAFDKLAPGFDVVGFDPRGVADSGDRGCGPSPAMDPALDTPDDTDFQRAVQAAIADHAAEGERCANHWGPLFNHLGSNQVVRDMEAMRQALGETKLNYLGISYGTRLGALYAHTFPESVGLMVLDAAVTPQVDMMKEAREGFAQLLVLQDVFFQDCDADVLSCPPEARALFDDMIAAAGELGIGVEVGQYWAGALAYPSSREALPSLLTLQETEPDSSWLLGVAADPGIFVGIGQVANRNVTCIDATTEPPTIPEFEALYAELYAQSPVFASQAGVALLCAGWPVTRDPVPMPSAAAAPPILVIGGTQDLLTPLSNAQEMTAALGNATLLISNHYGHSAIAPENRCVIDAITNYMSLSQLPADGTLCDD